MTDDAIPLDMPDLSRKPMFEFTCTVKKLNQYGDKSLATYPAVVLASTIGDAVGKLRTAFGATYDDLSSPGFHRGCFSWFSMQP
ncbi:MAG: hypothetical protein L0G59_05010, partial [Kocuria sp.]|nr:hypothetical protein [Kocuria sp.]